MQHANAPLTQNGRLRMVLLVEEEGFTLRAAADACNVAKSTCWEWVRRWRAASEPDRVTLACLQDRDSRPHRSRTRCRLGRPHGSVSGVSALVGARDGSRKRRTFARPHSTIHQVLRRGGCSRQPRPEAPAVVRYQWPCPGNLLHMDVKKFGRFQAPGHALTGDRTRRSPGAGWEYVHSIIDDCSRLAYSEIHDDETAATVTAFTRRALDWFLDQGIVCERVMTHIRIRPYTPRTNGKVERFHQTLMREWAYALQYASSDARQEALPHWINHYNERRTHSALSNRPPRARVRDVTGHNT